MGIYLNPGCDKFKISLSSQIYVDKSKLINHLNLIVGTEQRFVCVSRPRRFGKSMAANMIAAYYQQGINTKDLFQDLNIAKSVSFKKHLNQYNVIFLNMQEFFSRTHNIERMEQLLEKGLLKDLLRAYPDIDYLDSSDLISVLLDIYNETRIGFVFIIDEWDCIFRENQNDAESQKLYLDFLRNLLKDKSYIKLAYMTGILPIKKYGTHSALNMFSEFSMTSSRQLSEYVGFTQSEVSKLCDRYQMSFDETKRWYDGYSLGKSNHIYNPKSVVEAMLNQGFDSYWTKTESYEALKIYIEMNFDGLKDTIIKLLAGARIKINTDKFTNDMTTFQGKDDVITLLIHLGYLAYDVETEEVFIPNHEISKEFLNAIDGAGWRSIVDAISTSEKRYKPHGVWIAK